MSRLAGTKTLSGIALVTWFVVMLGVGAGLLARHWLPFQSPNHVSQVAASLNLMRRSDERGGWLAVHVLYGDCRCSTAVAEHLARTVRPHGWTEVVLWVGEPGPSLDLVARFDVRRITSAELASLGVEAAPLLVALDPEGRVHYVGGYSEQKQGPLIDDRRLLSAARESDRVPSLPIYGCAVSARLKQELTTLPTL